MRSLGIDVGGHRKKLDLVLLDDRRQPFPVLSHVDVGDVARLVRELRPDVVAIDSPPDWGPPGAGSRETERQLAMLGIRSFNTPGRDRGEGNAFYDWMQMGFEVFRAAARAGFPRFDGRTVRGTAIEVFPHATETVLAGCLPPLGAGKKAWRIRLLRTQSVGVADLHTLDQVDAALAALTGLVALELRRPFAPGIPNEGVIVLPTRVPPGPYARCEAQAPDDTLALIHFCACGCGAEVRPGREFRAGHDAKLKTRLVRAMRGGRRRAPGARTEEVAVTDERRFETKAIHAGQDPEALYGAVNVPIYQTSTYAQDAVGAPKRWDYARGGNPTREAFQVALAALEGGERGFAFASGLGAETTLLLTLRPGDHVVLADDVYGGTYRLLSQVLAPWGLAFTTVDLTDLDALRAAIRPETRIVWVETPSNPLLKIVDIAAVADVAHDAGARVVVDNTFATPVLQRPLELGADAVVHSVTKYLGGHSDLIGGAIVTSDADWIERLGFLTNAIGAVPGPMDSYLALRGLKTLAVRMRAHCDGARAIAGFLQGHPKVVRVAYPGLPSHPGHDLAARQMSDFGGMVSFQVGSAEEALRVAGATRLFLLAESLGAVESLIEVPGPMTHASVAGSPLEVPDDLIRLSVGIEHPDDLIADLTQALG